METYRYANPVGYPDTSYLIDEYSKSCRALGLKIKLYETTNIEYTLQGEPIYERNKIPKNGYCLIDDYIPSDSTQLSEEYDEPPEKGSKILYLPIKFGDDGDYSDISELQIGSLVEIVDDLNIAQLEFGTYILEDVIISPDRSYLVCNAFIHKTTRDEASPDPGGAKENFSFIRKPGKK